VRGVSDLIGRIAARAVGAPALAQPRAAAPLVGEGGLEVLDEEVVVPSAGPVPADAAQPAGPVPAAAAAPRASNPARDIAAKPVTEIEVPPAAGLPGPAAEELPRRGRHLSAPQRASVDPTEVQLGVPAAEPRAAATAVPVLASAAAPVVTAPPPAPAAVTTTREEQPPVRVHIGRLEVRANLQEQPRPVPVPQPAEPEALSLSDYLRGRR
jgi:hypothetical protein